MSGADLEEADIRVADFTGVDVFTLINLELAKNADKAKGLVKPESEPVPVTEQYFEVYHNFRPINQVYKKQCG